MIAGIGLAGPASGVSFFRVKVPHPYGGDAGRMMDRCS